MSFPISRPTDAMLNFSNTWKQITIASRSGLQHVGVRDEISQRALGPSSRKGKCNMLVEEKNRGIAKYRQQKGQSHFQHARLAGTR